MLKLFAHELQGKYNFIVRPFMQMKRAKNFNQSEFAGVEVNGNWAQSQLRRADVDALQETMENVAFLDYFKSKGSYVTDVDGHVLLDLSSTESLPLGHNHPKFVKVR
jgi:4-aminobutyrate aminotransferase-like enzyme